MSIVLGDVLKHPTLVAADPLMRTDIRDSLSRQVRWVHSSEVLDIAPLLQGGELLLSGGQALAAATMERQMDYVRDLAHRGIAALAVETGPDFPSFPDAVVAVAQADGLPLLELRRVVPFVGIMQALNSVLVSESVAQLQSADTISHDMATTLAHGGGLDQVLEVLANGTRAKIRLTAPGGKTLGSSTAAGASVLFTAGAAPQEETPGSEETAVTVDIPIRGTVAAVLEISVAAGADAGFARLVGERCIDVLALALLQRMPPGLSELAGLELMHAIISGSQTWRLPQLGLAAGFPADANFATLVVRSSGVGKLRSAVEERLRTVARHCVSYVDKSELITLASLQPAQESATTGTTPSEVRSAMIDVLREVIPGNGSKAAMGPTARGIRQAPWSLAEARQVFELASHPAPMVIDAEAYAVERLAARSIPRDAREAFVRQQLGNILDHDEQRKSQLLRTLAVWLDTGCNTAQAARELHLERQSMHLRLQRIFELCGGDPRGSGKLAALHLAARLGLATG